MQLPQIHNHICAAEVIAPMWPIVSSLRNNTWEPAPEGLWENFGSTPEMFFFTDSFFVSTDVTCCPSVQRHRRVITSTCAARHPSYLGTKKPWCQLLPRWPERSAVLMHSSSVSTTNRKEYVFPSASFISPSGEFALPGPSYGHFPGPLQSGDLFRR